MAKVTVTKIEGGYCMEEHELGGSNPGGEELNELELQIRELDDEEAFVVYQNVKALVLKYHPNLIDRVKIDLAVEGNAKN